MNNEHFAHTADPVFPAAFLFNSVGPGRQSTHQLLVISNTELKYQHLLFKIHKSSICLNLYLFLNFFERTINQFFLSLQPHFFTKEASCSPSLAECMSSVFSLEWALLSELGILADVSVSSWNWVQSESHAHLNFWIGTKMEIKMEIKYCILINTKALSRQRCLKTNRFMYQ